MFAARLYYAGRHDAVLPYNTPGTTYGLYVQDHSLVGANNLVVRVYSTLGVGTLF